MDEQMNSYSGSERLQRERGRNENGNPGPIRLRVLLVLYNPMIKEKRKRRLVDVLGWNDPDRLVDQFIEDIRYASHGICQYEISHREEVDAFPVKVDGFTYSSEEYITCWQVRQGFHQPDWVDYHLILEDFQIIPRINSGNIDEVWLFGFPYAGFYESRMVGPASFWCNAPPLNVYEHSTRRFIVMGFNYERGVGEMLESYGHRAESIMAKVFQDFPAEKNHWERFTRYDLTHPGMAEVGNVHFAPNSRQDYDWGNRSLVPSRCDNWYRYPNLRGKPRMVNCQEWGNGNVRKHHLWWFLHFPHGEGKFYGISNNWWRYVTMPEIIGFDYDAVGL